MSFVDHITTGSLEREALPVFPLAAGLDKVAVIEIKLANGGD